MSETLNILLRADEYKGKTLKEVHDTMINSLLFEDFSNVFDFFSFWEEGNESFAGSERPEELRVVVKNWNSSISAEVNAAEKALKEVMKKEEAEHMSDLESSGDMILWNLRQALCARTDLFTYGQNYLYRDDDSGWHTWLPKEVVVNVKEHPEEYILIQVFYH